MGKTVRRTVASCERTASEGERVREAKRLGDHVIDGDEPRKSDSSTASRRDPPHGGHAATSYSRAVAVGVVGGLLGGLAMNAYARATAAATDGREAAGASPGTDRVGRGMQPPQADGRAENDAAVRVGSAVYTAVTRHQPDRPGRRRLGVMAHYGFSAAIGVCYVLLARRRPLIRRGFGCLYGAVVWAVADEGVMPGLGLSRSPRALTAGVHAYSLLGHCVYGATLECARRIGMPDSAATRRA